MREWSDGAVMLGKRSVDNSRARAYCAYSRCGLVGLDIFLSSIFSFSLFGRRSDID